MGPGGGGVGLGVGGRRVGMAAVFLTWYGAVQLPSIAVRSVVHLKHLIACSHVVQMAVVVGDGGANCVESARLGGVFGRFALSNDA